MNPIPTISLVSAAALTAAVMATSGEDTPKEFGAVRWGRELSPALARASTSHKPIMLLFQEVPG